MHIQTGKKNTNKNLGVTEVGHKGKRISPEKDLYRPG